MERPPSSPRVSATPEQEGQLYAELGQPDIDYARLGALIGLRRGQLFSQRWELLRWDLRVFVVPPFKQQRARFVPIPEEGMAILRRLHHRQTKPSSGPIFPKPNDPTQSLDPNNWYRRRFKPAAIRAGLYQPESKHGITFHSLRHTWADRLAEQGAQSRVIQKAGGWSSLKLVEWYTDPHDEAVRQAVERAGKIKPKPVKLQKTATTER